MSDAKLGTSPATVDERRALDAEERQLADMTRPPGVERHSDDDLAALVSRLRERRNRARELADRQAREARAKAAPAGAAAAKSDAGMRSKHDYLTEALDRATAEQDRRATAGSRESQADLSRKALDLKDSGAKPNAMAEDGRALHPKDPDASAGKADMADTARNVAPSGALDHAGELPSRERSRTRY